MDDEFNGSSLDPKWTVSNSGGSPYVVARGRLAYSTAGVTQSLANGILLRQPKPTGFPQEYQLKFWFNAAGGGNPWVALGFYDSATGKQAVCAYGWINGAMRLEFEYMTNGTWSSAPSSQYMPGQGSDGGVVLKVTDDGANVRCRASVDGGFSWTGSEIVLSRTAWLPTGGDRIEIESTNSSSFDWFRRTQ
jgi:hypothetical protein